MVRILAIILLSFPVSGQIIPGLLAAAESGEAVIDTTTPPPPPPDTTGGDNTIVETFNVNFYYLAGTTPDTSWNNANRPGSDNIIIDSDVKNSLNQSRGVQLRAVRRSGGSGFGDLGTPTSTNSRVPNVVWQRGFSCAYGDTATYRIEGLVPDSVYTFRPLCRAGTGNDQIGDSAAFHVNGVTLAVGQIRGNTGHLDSVAVAANSSGQITFDFMRRGRWGDYFVMGFILDYTPGKMPSASDPEVHHPSYYGIQPYTNTATDSIVTITYTFNAPPTNLSVTLADMPYDKDGAIVEDYDDGNWGAVMAMKEWQNRTYTDGCGNDINYTAGIAVNSVSILDSVTFGTLTKYSYSGAAVMVPYDFSRMVNLGWDLMNHGYSHRDAPSLTRAIAEWEANNTVLYDSLNYLSNVGVVPTNYGIYVEAADSLGFLAQISANAPSSYPRRNLLATSFDAFDWTQYQYLSREFLVYLDGDATNYANWTSDIDFLLANSNAATHYVFNWGNHDKQDPLHFDIYEYIETNANDRLIVCPMRQLVEYQHVANDAVISTQVSGNTVTITVNYSQVDPSIRWHNMTFYVDSDATLTGVSSSDSISYNLVNGLTNIFRQKMIWTGAIPSEL